MLRTSFEVFFPAPPERSEKFFSDLIAGKAREVVSGQHIFGAKHKLYFCNPFIFFLSEFELSSIFIIVFSLFLPICGLRGVGGCGIHHGQLEFLTFTYSCIVVKLPKIFLGPPLSLLAHPINKTITSFF